MEQTGRLVPALLRNHQGGPPFTTTLALTNGQSCIHRTAHTRVHCRLPCSRDGHDLLVARWTKRYGRAGDCRSRYCIDSPGSDGGRIVLFGVCLGRSATAAPTYLGFRRWSCHGSWTLRAEETERRGPTARGSAGLRATWLLLGNHYGISFPGAGDRRAFLRVAMEANALTLSWYGRAITNGRFL